MLSVSIKQTDMDNNQPFKQQNSADLHNGVADASSLFAEHLVLQRLIHDDVGHLLQVHWAWIWKKQRVWDVCNADMMLKFL